MTGTLAERLGYGPEDRLLIVNCEDLGASHAGNVAIYRAMVYGMATNTTLMTTCPWAREAVDMFKGRAVGVHFTLTGEYPGYRWRGLTNGKTLHDDQGYLPTTGREALARLDAEDARTECRAQIETALGWGVDATHLDGHMGVMQNRSDLFEVYLDLAVEYRLPVRMHSQAQSDKQGFQARERARARGVLFNDNIVSPWGRRTRDVFTHDFAQLPPGVCEAIGHPVMDGEELRGFDRDNADIRVHDAETLTDPAMMGMLDELGIKRISYRELRELQRAA